MKKHFYLLFFVALITSCGGGDGSSAGSVSSENSQSPKSLSEIEQDEALALGVDIQKITPENMAEIDPINEENFAKKQISAEKNEPAQQNGRKFDIYMQFFSNHVPEAGKLQTIYNLQSSTNYNRFITDKEKQILNSLKNSKSILMLDYEPPNNKLDVVLSAKKFSEHLDSAIVELQQATALTAANKKSLANLVTRTKNASTALETHKEDRFRIVSTGVNPLLKVYDELNTFYENHKIAIENTDPQINLNYLDKINIAKNHLETSLQPSGDLPVGTPPSKSSVVNIQDPFGAVLSDLFSYYKSLNPKAKLGLYAVLPWNSYCGSGKANTAYNSAIGDKVDYLAPVVYWTYCGGSINSFRTAANNHINAAKQAQPNKDVYLVLGPGSDLSTKGYEAMKQQLEIVYSNSSASGVLIWATSATDNAFNKTNTSCQVKNARYSKCWVDAVAEFSCEINRSKNNNKCAKYYK